MMRPARRTLLALSVTLAILACEAERAGPPTVNIIAHDYEFTAPDTVPAGWITFQLHNQGSEPHNLEIDRLPDGMTAPEFRTWSKRDSALRDSLAALIDEGRIARGEAIRAYRTARAEALRAYTRAAPDTNWRGGLDEISRDVGVVGILSPGENARTTVLLESGTYRLRCAMPTAEGEGHSILGMRGTLVVTGSASDAIPPEPDVIIQYDAGEVTMEGQYEAGRQIVAFQVGELGATQEHGKIDAHLVDLDGTSREAVVRWMNEEGFRPPAPATFLGGPDEIREGDTVYLSLELDAGRYGWVFTPDTDLRLKEFTIE